MTKPMPYRKLAKLLKKAGFASRQGKGDHEVWRHETGISVSITRTVEISPGLVRKALKAIEESEKAS
ncbi:type II toxin-antitoxin system HicA family toxin [Schaalia sp. ZJ405]|uniref:type II toxin-antitoxin system HicA family toxin n=1 Tax=Schaalia sp. ZJ405 TaxID=2709403 RepID=UPI0013EAD5EF|nr:type II toxin-antitoxin system HicA family toxin [Schaalia sp. ZJ405]QPK80777.1 type II toxin-antitoxin system HicA family toxin [Schaalia sp. ZJ405]